MADENQIRVNIKARVNSAEIRHETRNGREKIIIPSATLPDDIVMNGRKFPADVIAASFADLNNKPAPLGHPMVGGQFISATDPEGLNISFIGAHNENARQVRGENGRNRVFVDKVIDVARAKESEGGRRVLAAIDQKQPIHTSVAVYCADEPAPEGAEYNVIASMMCFDHDAILLDEPGAATPEQGVGLFVNSKGEESEIPVVNSSVDDQRDEMEWLAHRLATMADQNDRAPIISGIASKILSAMGLGAKTNAATKQTKPEKESEMSDEKIDALTKAVGDIAANQAAQAAAVGEAITNALKPLIDSNAAIVANQKAAEAAELSGYVEKIVANNVMPKEAAETLSLVAAKALADTLAPGTAVNLSVNYNGDAPKNEFADYDINAHMDEGKKS